MQDRIPQYPGRVTLTPVEGQENTYDMVRADQPTQEGTPLSKANLLKDSTAAMYVGARVNVPDDALAYVGKFAQYWWKLQRGEAYTIYKEKQTEYTRGSGDYLRFFVKNNYYLQYSSQISIDQETGAVSLVDPMTYTEPADTNTGPKKCAALRDELRGKYVTGMSKGDTIYQNNIGDYSSNVFYIPENATAAGGQTAEKTFSFSKNDDGDLYVYLNGETDRVDVPGMVVGFTPEVVPPDQPTYVHSSDRNAYPDSGTVDGITYTYLGCPFEKFPTAPQIETGSYTGTGVSENILTFGFSPKLVVIMGDNVSTSTSVITTGTALVLAILVKPVEHGFGIDTVQSTSFRERFRVSWDDNTVSYRYDLANASANAYNYLALG